MACPGCGSDYDTGWKRDWGSGSPEDEFDYEESFRKEFGSNAKPDGVKPIWWITGIALLILFVAGLIKALM